MRPSARNGSIAPLSGTSGDIDRGIVNPTWEQLYNLEQRFSDSFYLFTESRFVENYNKFLSAFSRIYPNTRIAYSYKTNYLPRICQLVNDRDGYAEVVSSMELELARSVGVASDHIVFNGPYKTEADIEDALRTGVILNVDSPYEISCLSRVVEKYPRDHFSVGIRCNLACGGLERSRFGFDASGDGLEAVVSRLQALGSVSVVGLHCHYCPEGRLPRTYAGMMEAMIDLAKRFIPCTKVRAIPGG